MCGFAAKDIQKSGNGTILDLIALDPAQPLFGLKKCEERLCETDAKHVVAIHTSILGIQYSIGEVDLWFNGGKEQSDCGEINYYIYTLKDDKCYENDRK